MRDLILVYSIDTTRYREERRRGARTENTFKWALGADLGASKDEVFVKKW